MAAARRQAITDAVMTGRLFTGPQLAALSGGNLRTIYRDVEHLVERGVPIIAKRGVGFYRGLD